MATTVLYSPAKRTMLKLVLVFLLLLLLAAAMTIPFIWESETLWYKIGFKKTLLRTGKCFGIFAAILVSLQIVLASRQILLDKVFGLDRLYVLHRINGVVLICFAAAHVGMVLIPEGIANLPIGWKFWPEMVGAALFFLLISTIAGASLRNTVIPYHQWRNIHRPVGFFFGLALPVHILFVSESFSQAVPKFSLLALAGSVALSVAARKIVILKQKKSGWKILRLENLADSVMSLHVAPPPSFLYAPGQFAFIQLHCLSVSGEPHPFTIASSPAGGAPLQFMIKNCGDWTRALTPEKTATIAVEGPYGLFSYTAQPKAANIMMIAGGIGITPFLSMLRNIAAEPVQPEICLLWSLHCQQEMFLENEFKLLKEKISALDLHILYTREKEGRRLDRDMLADILEAEPRDSHCYICGPPEMMTATGKILVHLGFDKGNIFKEEFAL